MKWWLRQRLSQLLLLVSFSFIFSLPKKVGQPPLNSKIANYVGKNFEKDKIQKISVVAKEIEFSILQALQGHDIFLRFT